MRLLTVGHGTLEPAAFASLLRGAGVCCLVDVRSFPGSRRNPAFGRQELERWLPAERIGYRWEPRLGGFRYPLPDSPNTALRHPSFRGYADHMRTATFRGALEELLADAAAVAPGSILCIMCAESLWWRCHRRLIADAATLVGAAEVDHLLHDGRLAAHRLTDGVRVDGDGLLVYDGGPR